MKTNILAAAALSLLCVPLFAKTPAPTPTAKASAMNPSNIGNVSATGQSLRYKRPNKRRVTGGNPSDVRSTSPSGQSLRYKGPGRRSTKRRASKTTKRTTRSSSRTSR